MLHFNSQYIGQQQWIEMWDRVMKLKKTGLVIYIRIYEEFHLDFALLDVYLHENKNKV